MKTLLLLRHAKSSWKHTALPDHDRPLNKRGREAAPRIAQLIAAEGLHPDFIVSSTAARALATAHAVAEACDYPRAITVTRQLYETGPEAYGDLIATLDDVYTRVLIVGHNPALEQFVEQRTGTATPLPTAALAHLQFPIQHWRDLLTTIGQVVKVWRVRELEIERLGD